MNLSDTLALLDKLKEIGAKQFRDGSFEVSLSGQPAPMHIHQMPDAPSLETEPAPQPKQEYNQANTDKVQKLIDLLKMKDEMLVNEIFPEGA